MAHEAHGHEFQYWTDTVVPESHALDRKLSRAQKTSFLVLLLPAHATQMHLISGAFLFTS